MDRPEPASEGNELKIIGAGLGRTGTMSLKVALEELGFNPCYHMTEVFERPADIAVWEAAAMGKPIDWKALFAGYQATVDWPACIFYKELMQVYPDAKVLLTVRNPESWYESAESTIFQMRNRPPLDSEQIRAHVPDMQEFRQMTNAVIRDRTFGGNYEDKEHAIAVFEQHIAEVRQHVAPEKLLVYEVKEGWEPLCAFLEVEIPEGKPFPHLNDRDHFGGNRLREQQS
jgi:sulfotransferase family protein